MAVEREAGDAAREEAVEAVAEGLHAAGGRALFVGRDAAGGAEGRRLVHGLGARPEAALLAGAVDDGGERQAAPNVEGAHSLGGVELVARDREQVHAYLLDPRGDLPHRLRGVGVEGDAALAGDPPD